MASRAPNVDEKAAAAVAAVAAAAAEAEAQGGGVGDTYDEDGVLKRSDPPWCPPGTAAWPHGTVYSYMTVVPGHTRRIDTGPYLSMIHSWRFEAFAIEVT